MVIWWITGKNCQWKDQKAIFLNSLINHVLLYWNVSVYDWGRLCLWLFLRYCEPLKWLQVYAWNENEYTARPEASCLNNNLLVWKMSRNALSPTSLRWGSCNREFWLSSRSQLTLSPSLFFMFMLILVLWLYQSGSLIVEKAVHHCRVWGL